MESGHDATVGDSESADAADLELLVEHGHSVVGRSHLAGAGSVVAGGGLLFDVGDPFLSGGESVVCQICSFQQLNRVVCLAATNWKAMRP